MLRKLMPVLILLLSLVLSACGTAAPAQAPTAAPAQPKELREITLAMPYIPNVQFAQFYVADKQGYYAAEGIKVNFDYNFETDVVKRVAEGTVQFGMASGDSVLLARGQGLPDARRRLIEALGHSNRL